MVVRAAPGARRGSRMRWEGRGVASGRFASPAPVTGLLKAKSRLEPSRSTIDRAKPSGHRGKKTRVEG